MRPARRAGPAPAAGASRLLLSARGGLAGLARLGSDRRRSVARPGAQRRVRALGRDGVVGGEGGADLSKLLPRQAEAGERAIPVRRFEGLQAADGLEGLRGVAEAAQLQLGLTFQQERAGSEVFLIARRGRLGLRRGLGPFFLLECRLGEIVRRLVRQRVVREFLAEAPP